MAIDYLNKVNQFSEVATPDMIVMDINLPKINGKEVLQFVKKSPEFQSIPVIMYTSSDSPTDIAECLSLEANAYITKVNTKKEQEEAVEKFKSFFVDSIRFV